MNLCTAANLRCELVEHYFARAFEEAEKNNVQVAIRRPFHRTKTGDNIAVDLKCLMFIHDHGEKENA